MMTNFMGEHWFLWGGESSALAGSRSGRQPRSPGGQAQLSAEQATPGRVHAPSTSGQSSDAGEGANGHKPRRSEPTVALQRHLGAGGRFVIPPLPTHTVFVCLTHEGKGGTRKGSEGGGVAFARENCVERGIQERRAPGEVDWSDRLLCCFGKERSNVDGSSRSR